MGKAEHKLQPWWLDRDLRYDNKGLEDQGFASSTKRYYEHQCFAATARLHHRVEKTTEGECIFNVLVYGSLEERLQYCF